MTDKLKQQLIIIPGWGGTKKSWQAFMDLASADFDIFFIELPCSEDLPCPNEVWGVEEYAAFVNQKITALNLQTPVLFGHSFGGQIAVNLAGNNPGLFGKLILSGAAVLRPKHTVKRFIYSLIAKTGKLIFSLPLLNKIERLAKKFLYKAADAHDYGETDGIKREIFKKIIRQSQLEQLPKINIPTLVIWGSKDSYVPLCEGRKIARLIAGAKLEVVKGGKHGLHIQQPENLLKIIKSYSD